MFFSTAILVYKSLLDTLKMMKVVQVKCGAGRSGAFFKALLMEILCTLLNN
jgi:hypothetical protein